MAALYLYNSSIISIFSCYYYSGATFQWSRMFSFAHFYSQQAISIFGANTGPMKKLYPLLSALLLSCFVFAQSNVGIGTPTPDPTSILDLTSTSQGFLAPRLTTTQRLAIANPAPGLLVYDTNISCYFSFNGTWTSLCQPASAICPAAANGYISMFISDSTLCNSLLFQSGSNVGVNTINPAVSFQDNATDALGLPAGTTAQQPAGAPTGAVRFNTTTGSVEVYTGACWQNINTPPIGATYMQWFNALDPNTLYPCTQWVSSDLQNGEFIRAAGGNSNIPSGGPLTGTLQAQQLLDHTHSATITIDSAGPFVTDSAGLHFHDWGGWWSNDDSRDYATTNGNGDGTSNTNSDGSFYWGGNPAITLNPNSAYYAGTTVIAGAHNHGGSTGAVNTANPVWIPYDDNLSTDAGSSGFSNSDATTCGNGWNGEFTCGNFMGQLSDACMAHTHIINTDGAHTHEVDFYAHRHFLKQRPTSSDGMHVHTVPEHTHTGTATVGNVNSGSAGPENRPANVAVIFWRRTN